jgi:NAD-dependent deacetylase
MEAEHHCRSCEVLLVIGTSAEVYPACGLIDLAKRGGAKIIIVNTQPSEASRLADVELIGKAGEILPDLLSVPVPDSH